MYRPSLRRLPRKFRPFSTSCRRKSLSEPLATIDATLGASKESAFQSDTSLLVIDAPEKSNGKVVARRFMWTFADQRHGPKTDGSQSCFVLRSRRGGRHETVVAAHPVGVQEVSGAGFIFAPEFQFAPGFAVGRFVSSAGSAGHDAAWYAQH